MPRKVVLVTGAGGFIGRWSVPALIARGYEVHAVLARSAGRGLAPQLAGAVAHWADLLDGDVPRTLVGEIRPSHLLHFAWTATPGVYWTSPDNYRWLAASQTLLAAFAATGGGRAVMAGTAAEYDWSRVSLCDERTSPLADAPGADAPGGATPGAAAPGARLPYAECKLAMQRALAAFSLEHRLSTAWGRIFFQYGPDEHPDRLVASVIINLLQSREAPCSHGAQIRSFLHVADVGSAFAALLDSDTQGPVNIGSDQPLRIADLVQIIGGQLHCAQRIRLGARASPVGEPPLLVPATARLHDEVGWRPRFGLQEGIADTIDWWRQKLSA